ncbi:MAG TPA: RNA ligase (ATP) [Parapedobacter sp.]|nr:RNA ligase (ATP) [Parapedobacter sp.]
MSRKLASIVTVENLSPIPEADLIEVATVKGWKVVVKKNEFEVGDPAVYCEIDSFLPIREEFEFLRKTSYRKMRGVDGFRLKTIKLRGQISQGLLLPASILGDLRLQIGDDVTEHLGIIKYEPPIPASLVGIAKGPFPSFIPKTDEERIQNLLEHFESLMAQRYYVSEKLDGSSVTYYLHNGHFGVCSRNLELLASPDNTLWKFAHENKLADKLISRGRNIALQGELIGEGVQGNPYKLTGQSVRFFYLFDVDKHRYLPMEEFFSLMEALELETVPILSGNFQLPETIDEILALADGVSKLNPPNKQVAREGLVFRNADRTVSFKAISNRFLLKDGN